VFRFAGLWRPRLFTSRRALRPRRPFRFRRLLFWRSGRLPWRTAGACRFWLGLNQAESEIVVLRGVVGWTARFGGPDDRFVFFRFGCRFRHGCNRFRLDVQTVEIEWIVVQRGRSQSSGAAEEVVCQRLPIVVGALLLKWIVHGVTLSLACGEFKIARPCRKWSG
jgi:hypothetical protein